MKNFSVVEVEKWNSDGVIDRGRECMLCQLLPNFSFDFSILPKGRAAFQHSTSTDFQWALP